MADEEAQTWAQKLEEDVKRALEDMPEYEKVLAMYRELLLAQNEAKSKLPAVEVDMDADRAAVCADTGVTLLGEVDAKLDAEAAAALFGRLKEIAAGHGEEFAEEAGKLTSAVESGKLDVEAVLEEAFRGQSSEELKKQAMDLDLDPHFFALLVYSSIRPNLEIYAQKLAPLLDDKDWDKRSCPVCGRLPYITKLVGEEGRRVLCCPACSTTWRFPRLKCVNCGIDNHEKLRMLYAEGKSRERYADVCDNCKRYLKVIDTRKMARSPIMMIADASTLHIDMLAQREGFVAL